VAEWGKQHLVAFEGRLVTGLFCIRVGAQIITSGSIFCTRVNALSGRRQSLR
jgi:hypothetical protein